MLNTERRVWQWKVEPGMEDAFDDLLGWLLSSQRETEVETVRVLPANPPSQRLRRNPMWSRCCSWAVHPAA